MGNCCYLQRIAQSMYKQSPNSRKFAQSGHSEWRRDDMRQVTLGQQKAAEVTPSRKSFDRR
jgi:hypothetical protein